MNPDIEIYEDGIQRIRRSSVDISSHHYIVLTILERWILEKAVPSARGEFLDFGCGGQPYRVNFESRISRYIGADVAAASGVQPDIRLIPGQPVPMPDASVDTILSTQVLEHVSDIDSYIAECSRLLRSGGKLLISVPMQWRHHEVPHDYWRFTRYGLEEVLQRHGFIVESTTPCGGVFAMLGQILASHLGETGWRKPWLMRLINRIAMRLDRLRSDTEDTLNWMSIARKP